MNKGNILSGIKVHRIHVSSPHQLQVSVPQRARKVLYAPRSFIIQMITQNLLLDYHLKEPALAKVI